jgi:hypothetical protein
MEVVVLLIVADDVLEAEVDGESRGVIVVVPRPVEVHATIATPNTSTMLSLTPIRLHQLALCSTHIGSSVAISPISECAPDRHFGARYELSTRM